MGFEEGEIVEQNTNASTVAGVEYDPSYEWPGDDLNASSDYKEPSTVSKHTTSLRPNQPTFRLIVLRTAILPSKHKLAVIDGFSEVQFGRDLVPPGSKTPKIRLKEMEVSKLHAMVYWDAIRREWSIVDMGSVHGTFLRAAQSPEDHPGLRLSPPRQASIPRRLNHMDQLIIGSTTFVIHMHHDRLPCEECWASNEDEIPLFAKSSKNPLKEPLRAESPSLYAPEAPKNAKKALNTLKQHFLERHSDPSLRSQFANKDQASMQYVDRSALRRSLMPTSGPDAPGVPPVLLPSRADPPASFTDSSHADLPVPPVASQPPVPLQSSNVGHRLLMKQGWEPGTALGLQRNHDEGSTGLVEPIEVKTSENRRGLGHKRNSPVPNIASQPDPDWKGRAKRRRWEEI